MIDAIVQVGHETTAFEKRGCTAGVIPVENEDGTGEWIAARAGAAHCFDSGWNLVEDGGEGGAVMRVDVVRRMGPLRS